MDTTVMTNFRHCHPAPRPKINYPRHGFRAECSQVTPEYITYWHTRGNHDQTDKMTPAHSDECVKLKLGEFLAIQTLQVKIGKWFSYCVRYNIAALFTLAGVCFRWSQYKMPLQRSATALISPSLVQYMYITLHMTDNWLSSLVIARPGHPWAGRASVPMWGMPPR